MRKYILIAQERVLVRQLNRYPGKKRYLKNKIAKNKPLFMINWSFCLSYFRKSQKLINNLKKPI